MAKPPTSRKPAARKRRLAPAEQARIAEIFRRFEDQESDPRTELDYASPYELVTAVALSAQATDVSVNKATARLFRVADTPQKMLALGEAELKPFISSIGLYNMKAKNLLATAKILVEQYDGDVPLTREALQALPGVGRKTASVVLNELRIEPAIAVDTHVFRVAHRLGLARGKTPDQVEAELMAITPAPLQTRAHHWLILHGRYVCKAQRPKCEDCPLGDLCPSRRLFVRP